MSTKQIVDIVLIGGLLFVAWDYFFNCSKIITPLQPYSMCKNPPTVTADPRLTERASRPGEVRSGGRGKGNAGSGGRGSGDSGSVDDAKTTGSGRGNAGAGGSGRGSTGITPATPSRREGITPSGRGITAAKPKKELEVEGSGDSDSGVTGSGAKETAPPKTNPPIKAGGKSQPGPSASGKGKETVKKCDGLGPLEWFACHVANGASILGEQIGKLSENAQPFGATNPGIGTGATIRPLIIP